MTDKQIIIDGVDVRKCVNRRWDNSQKIHLCYNSDTPLTSWGWCENNPNCYYKQLKRKEQENEELTSKCSQLKQTLTEIKEIAEDFGFNGTYESYKTAIEQILQKINKVEDVNNNR